MEVIDYGAPGLLTGLGAIDSEALAGIGSDPVEICAPVRSLVIQPSDAEALALGTERFATNQVREQPNSSRRSSTCIGDRFVNRDRLRCVW